jgi:hypothetical protein
MLGLGLLAVVCEVAWNQGVDLYGYADNRLLAGVEYIAKYNLGFDVPYTTYDNCDHVNQTMISEAGRGAINRPIWEQIYNHYVNRMGLSAPYSEAYAQLMRPEGGGGNYGPNSGGYDHLGYGTLAFTLPPPTQCTAARTRTDGRSIKVEAPFGTLVCYSSAHATTRRHHRSNAFCDRDVFARQRSCCSR